MTRLVLVCALAAACGAAPATQKLEPACVPGTTTLYAYDAAAGGPQRTFGRVSSVVSAGRTGFLFSEKYADGSTHLGFGVGGAGLVARAPIAIFDSPDPVSVLQVRAHAGGFLALFEVRRGEYGEPGFAASVHGVRIVVGDDGVPSAGAAVQILDRAFEPWLAPSGDAVTLLAVDVSSSTPRLVLATIDPERLTATTSVVLDDLGRYDWYRLAARDEGALVLLREHATKHLVALALDAGGSRVGQLVDSGVAMPFAQPEPIAVGPDALALTHVDDTTLMLTSFDWHGALIASTAVATGGERAFTIANAVPLGTGFGVFYTIPSESDPDAAELDWATVDASGQLARAPERADTVKVYVPGAQISGYTEGPTSASGHTVSQIIPTHVDKDGTGWSSQHALVQVTVCDR